ncbi:hypothetical protein DFJ74DRAFT_704906 [Hyaloraphidium curvatum]|nr:hypothetical protein DFJ74DRAFT_704906 [Hyaloraphidium curvatum]
MKPYDSTFKPGLFARQVVIVTGGGTGIGGNIAHELAALGATVVIAARRAEPLLKTKAEIESLGGRCDVYHPLNIRDEKNCAAFAAEVVRRHGSIDGLVNNAGCVKPFLLPISR